jgi:hypothetical protein
VTEQTTELPEVGAAVHLEHVNFPIADQQLATTFFMSGLGLTRDPYKRCDETNMGVNVGMQQFHLPQGKATPPFPGEIGLLMPDLQTVRERLTRLQDAGSFADTPFAFSDAGDCLEVTSPFGIELRLHAAGSVTFLQPLGLVYVNVSVPRGTAEPVAEFYREIMHCPAQCTELDGELTAQVTVGPYQSLRYREREVADYATHNLHVAIYVTHFNELRRHMIERGNFLYDALDQTFFFQQLQPASGGDPLFHLQHEIRGLYHPDYMRPLVNRWPLVTEPFSDQATIRARLNERRNRAAQ